MACCIRSRWSSHHRVCKCACDAGRLWVILLGGRTSASAECRHWSGRAVRWSSGAILLRANPKMQKMDALPLPPAPLHYTVPMIMSRSQHPVQNDGPIGHGGSRRYANDGGPKTGPSWRTKSLNANEFLAMVATRQVPSLGRSSAATIDIGQVVVPMFGWFKSEQREQRKKVRQDRKHLEERARRFLKSYLDADQTRKPQFYRAVEDISKKCQPAELSLSQPDVDDRRFAEATSQAALQMVLDRVGRFSANDKVDDFVTDACATVAMAYHHAAGVYVADEKMKKLGTAAVHLLTMATLFIRAQRNSGTSGRFF